MALNIYLTELWMIVENVEKGALIFTQNEGLL